MSPSRSSLVLIAACSIGCASAREEPTENNNGPMDAAMSSGSDARLVDAQSLDASGSSTSPDSGPSSGCAFTGVLATWTFTNEAGNQASTAAGSSATGVTATAVQRSAGLTPVSGANSINSSSWPTAATADATKYYTFSVTPPVSCMLAITTLEIDAKASGTGPATASAGTSIDAFAQKTTLSTSAPGTITLNTNPTTNAVEVRVYGYSAGAAGGTLRLQTALTINGSLQ
ncbi:MAG: hypothetical protein HOV81_07405 [Kofleriaceae bacterium]|nr:hypothetical protein [Kofleriaceae bacterium]